MPQAAVSIDGTGIIKALVAYPGIQQIREAEYVCSHGVTPGFLVIKFIPQYYPDGTDMPPDPSGDFTISDNINGIITIPDCRLIDVVSRREDQGRQVWTAQFEDRRWRWRYGIINGCYNQLDPHGKLVPATITSPTELAEYCLLAMGEIGYTIDMPPGLDSSFREIFDDTLLLPNGVNFPPSGTNPAREWYGRNPAQALQELCDLFARRLVYVVSTDSVAIIPIGQGGPLPTGGMSINTQSPDLKLPESCDSVMVQGAPTCYQTRLLLQPVGLDWDGFYYPVNMLSYAPTSPGQKQITNVIVETPPDPTGALIGGGIYTIAFSKAGDNPELDEDQIGEVSYTLKVNDTAEDVGNGLSVAISADPEINQVVQVLSTEVIETDEFGDPVKVVIALQARVIGRDGAFSAAVDLDGNVESGEAIYTEDEQGALDPVVDWSYSPWPNFTNVRATNRLTFDQAQSLARDSVWRCYQVINVPVDLITEYTLDFRPVNFENVVPPGQTVGQPVSGTAMLLTAAVPQPQPPIPPIGQPVPPPVPPVVPDNPGIEAGMVVTGDGVTTDPSVTVVVLEVNWPEVLVSDPVDFDAVIDFSLDITQPAYKYTANQLTFQAPDTGVHVPGYGFLKRRQQLVLLNKQVDQIVPQEAPPTGGLGQEQIEGITILKGVRSSNIGDSAGAQFIYDVIQNASNLQVQGSAVPATSLVGYSFAMVGLGIIKAKLLQEITLAQSNAGAGISGVASAARAAAAAISDYDPGPEPAPGAAFVMGTLVAALKAVALKGVSGVLDDLKDLVSTGSATKHELKFVIGINRRIMRYTAPVGSTVSQITHGIVDAINNDSVASAIVEADFSSIDATSGNITIAGLDSDNSFNFSISMTGVAEDLRIEHRQIQGNVPSTKGIAVRGQLDQQYFEDLYQGLSKDKPPRVYGAISTRCLTASNGRIVYQTSASNTDPRDLVPLDVQINHEQQVVIFPRYVDLQSGPRGYDFPLLALQIAVNVRNEDTSQLEAFQQKIPVPWGPGTTINPKVEVHEDIQLNITSLFTQPGDLLGNPNELHSFQPLTLDGMDPFFRASYYLAGMIAQFNLSKAGSRVYNGILPIDCDGAIQQVGWRVSGSGHWTTAALNTEPHPLVPPYPTRRRLESMSAIAQQANRNQRINLWRNRDSQGE